MSVLLIINKTNYELTYIKKNDLISFELYRDSDNDLIIRIFSHNNLKTYITNQLSEQNRLILFNRIQQWLLNKSEKDLIIDISNNKVNII